MWDAVTSVDDEHDPILYEGEESAVVIVTNAGPRVVEVVAWSITKPKRSEVPVSRLELRPGNTKAIRGSLVRARLHEAQPTSDHRLHAAIGWRIVS
jgi:hypothetical protein